MLLALSPPSPKHVVAMRFHAAKVNVRVRCRVLEHHPACYLTAIMASGWREHTFLCSYHSEVLS